MWRICARMGSRCATNFERALLALQGPKAADVICPEAACAEIHGCGRS